MLVFAAMLAAPAGVRAASYTDIYTFTGPPGPIVPFGALSFGGGAVFYGTSYQGGTSTACGFGCGTVYALTLTKTAGQWNASVSTVYSFQGGDDGSGPEGGVVVGPHGVLFGTTAYGGGNQSGTVFALVPGAGGWTKTILSNFNGAGGSLPISPLLYGSDGALYGVAAGGQFGQGVVFQVKPGDTIAAPWTEQVLYNFPGGSGGQTPYSGLIGDPATAMYGTTLYGGAGPCTRSDGVGLPPIPGCGTVFSVTQPSPETWNTTLIYSFQGGPSDGDTPGPLSMGSDGTLYGATFGGGYFVESRFAPWGCGQAFSLAPSGPGGTWAESVLYAFRGPRSPACNPVGVTFQAPGRLLGTTSPQDADTSSAIFSLTLNGGVWKLGEMADDIGPAATSPAVTLAGKLLVGINPYGGGGSGSAFLATP
jgi:hypothetical protein